MMRWLKSTRLYCLWGERRKHVKYYLLLRDVMDVCAYVLLIWQYLQVKGVSFRTKFVVLAHGAAAKVNSALPLVGLGRVKQ